jgi:hypothetical protein
MTRRAAILWLGAALMAGVVSCGREPQTGSRSAQADEIRGEPIRAPVSTNAGSAAAVAPASFDPTSNPSGAPALVAAGSPVTPAPAPAEQNPGEPLAIGFDRLASFIYQMPDDLGSTNETAKSANQIPTEIRALDRKAIALKGFMLPLKVEGGLVTEMLMMRDQSMCCYGTVPKITEWVSVKMSGKGVRPVMDQPVTMFGTLRVGEMRENGYLIGIYAMDGEKLALPAGL